MPSNILDSTGDSWKELAQIYPTRPGDSTQMMLQRMDQIWPFAKAKGIFDIGCGPGPVVSGIAEEYGDKIPASTPVIAGDFSEHMLDLLRKTKQTRSEHAGDFWDRVDLRNIDAHDQSSIPEASISHVTGGMVYFLLPDPRKALRETNRILCPGGILSTCNGTSMQHVDALGKAMEMVRPGTNLTLLSGPWTTEEGVKTEFRETGFVDVETYLSPASFDYTSHDQAATNFLLMPAMKNAMEGFSEEEKSQMHQATVECLKEKNPAESGKFTGTRIVAVARKPGGSVSH